MVSQSLQTKCGYNTHRHTQMAVSLFCLAYSCFMSKSCCDIINVFYFFLIKTFLLINLIKLLTITILLKNPIQYSLHSLFNNYIHKNARRNFVDLNAKTHRIKVTGSCMRGRRYTDDVTTSVGESYGITCFGVALGRRVSGLKFDHSFITYVCFYDIK